MPTRLVLFDLDDTLSDHTAASRASCAAVCQRFPAFACWTLDEYVARNRRTLEEIHQRVLREGLSADAAREERHQRLLIDAGVAEAEATALAPQVAAFARQAYLAKRQCVPGARELLAALRPHATLGIVTNNLLAEQTEKLRHLALADAVDFMVVSEACGYIKPDPAIFRVALEQARIPAADAVMLGDSWTADILGATAAGIRAVWLNRHQAPCPDPTLAREIPSLHPTEAVAHILMNI